MLFNFSNSISFLLQGLFNTWSLKQNWLTELSIMPGDSKAQLPANLTEQIDAFIADLKQG